MPKATEGVELDEETREDLARWQRYVETGYASRMSASWRGSMSWRTRLTRGLR